MLYGLAMNKVFIALLERFWRISLYVYVTDVATAKLYSTVCNVKFSQIERNGRTFRHL